MITDREKKIITDWQEPEPLEIEILAADHPEQANFNRFSREWAALNSGITWKDGQGPSDLPGFGLKENIRYSALPLEKELAPFLKGLECLGAPDLDENIRKQLDRISLPCDLTLYIALQCPHCPAMVESLIPMAADCPHIRLHIIDGSLFPEKAGEDRVMSAPCLILDGDFRWTGAVPVEEIISMILDRDPAQLGTGTLKNILEEGNADWIADRMIEKNEIFKGFLGLLLHPTWSVRLGAMVVVEDLAERAPDLGLTLAPLLMEAYAKQDIPVQGDILYALGEIGNLETKAWIRKRIDKPVHQDLTDAAGDAMDAIDSRLAP